MLFTTIPFASPAYDESIALRDLVLRKPLKLQFTKEQLEIEWQQEHLVAYDTNYEMVATLCLLPLDDKTVKMRQVAVHPDCQGQGIGGQLVAFFEQYARTKGYSKVSLHARDVAIPFYKKLHYQSVGKPFDEVGIVHYKMVKDLL